MKKIFVFMLIFTCIHNTALAATSITIKEGAIKSTEGKHTISESFRESGNVRKTKQNYKSENSIVKCAIELGEILGNK